MSKYKFTDEKRHQFASTLILEDIINYHHVYSVVLDGDDKVLEPLFTSMLAHDVIDIRNNEYIPTEKGRKHLEDFMKKFREYLDLYDLYCAVDLNAGEFAFASWFDFNNDESWNEFLSEDRWEDVRVAVCEAKGIDALEVVFMSFVASRTFDLNKEGWQYDLMYETYWNEIVEICETNIHAEQLEEQDAMLAILEMGIDVMKANRQKQRELDEEETECDEIIAEEAEQNNQDDEEEYEVIVEEVEEVYYEDDYYDPYWDDPYYVSPFWITPVVWVY